MRNLQRASLPFPSGEGLQRRTLQLDGSGARITFLLNAFFQLWTEESLQEKACITPLERFRI